MALNTMMVQVVRYISECDVEPVLDPCTYAQAMADLQEVYNEAPNRLREFDLVSIETGQFVSWTVR